MKAPLYTTEILVQIAHISYGGHMGNDRFLTLAQEARIRWLKTLDLDETCLILAEAKLSFLKEVFWGEILIFELSIRDVTKCSMTLFYKVIEKKSQKIVSEITTKIVFFDYSTKKIMKMPKAITNLINETFDS